MVQCSTRANKTGGFKHEQNDKKRDYGKIPQRGGRGKNPGRRWRRNRNYGEMQ